MGCGCGGSARRQAAVRTAPSAQGPNATGYYWKGPQDRAPNGPAPKQPEPQPEPAPAE
jgi:hypothetical protein